MAEYFILKKKEICEGEGGMERERVFLETSDACRARGVLVVKVEKEASKDGEEGSS